MNDLKAQSATGSSATTVRRDKAKTLSSASAGESATKPKASILDGAIAARGWDPADDPGNICIKYPQAKTEPICYCPVLPKNMQGGMQPAIDLKEHRIACRVCGKTIPQSCGRASVRHLRGLLNAKPEHVDFAAIPDLLL